MADIRLPLSGTSTHKSVNPFSLKLKTSASTTVTYDGGGSNHVIVDLTALTVANADKWSSTRTFTIGKSDTGAKSVNGAGDVTWTLAEIGALPAAGGEATGRIYRAGASTSWHKGRDNSLIALSSISGYSPLASVKTTNGSWDIGSYSAAEYYDDLLFTYVTDTQYNGSQAVKTAQIKFLENGHIVAALDGNASTASAADKWTTARTLTIGDTANSGKSVDGHTDVSWSLADIGAAAVGHIHGNVQNNGTLQTTDVAIANGDKLVITDSSDSSKIARTSIQFDAATTTKALTQAGTWETTTSVNIATNDTSSTSTFPVVFAATNTSTTTAKNDTLGKSTGKLYFKPSTGELTATQFVGPLTGNVTGNCSGSSGSCTGNAATATQFSSKKSVALKGDVTGSASSKAGWSITTTIGESKVTNAMLAGSIENSKLANSTMTFGSQQISLGGEINLPKLLTDLGITRVFQYLGTVGSVPTGGTVNNITCVAGDMVLVSGVSSASDGIYVYNGSTWDKISSSNGAYKVLQTPSSGTGSTLKTIISWEQNANGDLTITYSDIQSATTNLKGVVQLASSYSDSDTTKAATGSTIASAISSAIGALDGSITGSAGSSKTLTAFSETNGIVSATFGNISITKSQISDFPSTMTPSSHTHGNLSNDGKITTAITIANNDYIIIGDNSESGKIGKGPVFDASTTTQCLTKAGTWANFNNYSLPTATYNTLGGVKPWYSHSKASTCSTSAGTNATVIAVNAITTTTGRYYAVESDSNGRLFVNVPWNGGDMSAYLPLAGGTMTGLVKVNGLKGTSSVDYGDTLPANGEEGRIFFQLSDATYELPTGGTTGQALIKRSNSNRDVMWSAINALPVGGSAGQALIKNSSTDGDVVWGAAGGILRPDASTKYYVGGSQYTTENTDPILFNTAIYVENSVLQGAAWNDYAEYRQTREEIQPGRCVVEVGDDTLELSTSRRQPGAEIVSDTYGFAIGQTEKCKTPIAVTGRVLAYPYEDISRFAPGRPVCSGPNGTVSVMSDDEARNYPWCIIGTVSSIPQEEYWGQNNVSTKGRVWIRVK